MEQLLFSIIIPTYNSCSSLRDCLDSIFQQTFSSFEVWIIDGDSTDNTLQIVEEYSINFRNLRWITEKDNGIYDAMNKGLNLANGEWVYFLGSDDRLYESSTLKNIATSINERLTDMIYGDVLIEGDSIWAKHGQVYNGEYAIDKLLTRNICHQAIFYKKELLVKTGGFNTDYAVCADWDINFHFFAKYKVQYTNQIIAFFTSSGLSSAKVYDKFLENDIVLKLRKYFGWSLFDKHFLTWKHLLKKNSEQFFKNGNLIKGTAFFVAYKYHNLKITIGRT